MSVVVSEGLVFVDHVFQKGYAFLKGGQLVLHAHPQARWIALQTGCADRPEFEIAVIIGGGNLDVRLKRLPTRDAFIGQMERDGC
jgi:hypothetical protein